jgi:secreted PhoX family phosphatase
MMAQRVSDRRTYAGGRHGQGHHYRGWRALIPSRNATHGLLVVNHEHTDPDMMFPEYAPGSPTRDQADIELTAHRVTVVELVRLPLGEWRYRIALIAIGA